MKLIVALVLLLLGFVDLGYAVKILVWSGGAMWSGFGQNPFHTPNYLGQNLVKPECPVTCEYVLSKHEFDSADGVLFEAQPFADFGYAYLKKMPDLPQKHVDQYFINFGYEHDTYFPIFSEPGFQQHIDINATFQQAQSEVPVTFTCSFGSYDTGSLEEFRQPPKVPYAEKHPHLGFMASNCHGGGAIYRTSYIKEMMKRITVDAMGMCMHNKDLDPEDNSHHLFSDLGDSFRIKRKVLSKYMFSIAFENNNKTDYVTEKVYTSLLSGSLPIYMGAPNIDEWVPEKSIVKTDDFASPEALVDHLIYLTKNKTAYEEYFEWKKKPFPEHFIKKYEKCIFYGADCRLCQAIQRKLDMAKMKDPGHRYAFGEPEAVKGMKKMISLSKPGSSCLMILQNDTIPAINGEFTAMMWMQPSNLDMFNSNLLSIGGGAATISISTVWKRDYLSFCFKGDHCFLSEVPLNIQEWKHVAVVVNKGDSPGTEVVSFFINGKLDSRHKTSAKPMIPSMGIKLGCDHSNRGFVGKVDDLIIWGRALNGTEIGQAMFKKFRGDEPQLLHYLTFNDAQPADYSKYRSPVEIKDISVEPSPIKKLDLNCC